MAEIKEIEQSLELDLVNIQHNIVTARQGDKLTRTLNVTITNNGYPYTIPSSAYVYLRGYRADGKVIFYLGEVSDSSNGIVKFDIHDFVLSVAGRTKLQVVIYSAEPNSADDDALKIASTDNFVLYIPEGSIDESQIVDSDEASALNQLLKEAQETMAKMEQIINNDEIVSETEPSQEDGSFWLKKV